MHPKLYASLHETMKNWLDEHCEDSEYLETETWTSPNAALQMARAAASVWDCMVDSSVFTKTQETE